MNTEEREFVHAAKQLLDESVVDLDSQTLAGLRRARSAALQGSRARPFVWRPVPTTALAVSLAVLSLFFAFSTLRQDSGDMLVADLGLLTSEDSVEFFEDMEFYEWLSILDGQTEDISGTHDLLLPPDDTSGQFCPAATNGNGAGNRNVRISWLI